jgi:hypothetical protein
MDLVALMIFSSAMIFVGIVTFRRTLGWGGEGDVCLEGCNKEILQKDNKLLLQA